MELKFLDYYLNSNVTRNYDSVRELEGYQSIDATCEKSDAWHEFIANNSKSTYALYIRVTMNRNAKVKFKLSSKLKFILKR